MFARLGSWCFRRRKTVAIAWVVGIVVVGSISGAVGGSFGQDFTTPGWESTRGLDTLEEEFGGQGAGMAGTNVFRSDAGVDDPEVQSTIESLVTLVPTLAEAGAVAARAQATFAALDEEALTALQQADIAPLPGGP